MNKQKSKSLYRVGKVDRRRHCEQSLFPQNVPKREMLNHKLLVVVDQRVIPAEKLQRALELTQKIKFKLGFEFCSKI